jgi:hypothetical protein
MRPWLTRQDGEPTCAAFDDVLPARGVRGREVAAAGASGELICGTVRRNKSPRVARITC